MRRTIDLPSEHSLLYSPIALLLQDEFTGQAPIERVTLKLQQFDDATNQWLDTDIQPYSSAEGILSYPGLGRTHDVDVAPRRFQILIEARLYNPFYRRRDTGDAGLEFEAFPYNDQSPLELDQYAHGPNRQEDFRLLLPSIRYPFPTDVPVVRGEVVDEDGNASPDTSVDFGLTGRSVTDAKGQFALPIRRLPTGTVMRQLAEDANQDEDTIVVGSLAGFAIGREIELERKRFTVVDIDSESRTLTLNLRLPQSFDSGTAVAIRWPPPPLWPPQEIRLQTDAVSGEDLIEVERLEGFSAQREIEIEDEELPPNERRFTVIDIDEHIDEDSDPPTVRRILALDRELPKNWQRGTRVQSFPFDIDISNSRGTHTHSVKVPDEFRDLTVSLPFA